MQDSRTAFGHSLQDFYKESATATDKHAQTVNYNYLFRLSQGLLSSEHTIQVSLQLGQVVRFKIVNEKNQYEWAQAIITYTNS